MVILDKTVLGSKKVNFVDEINNILLGYDLEDQCCEYAVWFVADSETECDERNGTQPGMKEYLGWEFDKDYFREMPDKGSDDKTSHVVFRMILKQWDTKVGATVAVKEKFIHLLNTHNGYYAHGFAFSTGTKTGLL